MSFKFWHKKISLFLYEPSFHVFFPRLRRSKKAKQTPDRGTRNESEKFSLCEMHIGWKYQTARKLDDVKGRLVDKRRAYLRPLSSGWQQSLSSLSIRVMRAMPLIRAGRQKPTSWRVSAALIWQMAPGGALRLAARIEPRTIKSKVNIIKHNIGRIWEPQSTFHVSPVTLGALIF